MQNFEDQDLMQVSRVGSDAAAMQRQNSAREKRFPSLLIGVLASTLAGTGLQLSEQSVA